MIGVKPRNGSPLLVMVSGARRVDTVVDETLARYPVVWTAAGAPDSVMPLSYAQLLAITEGVEMQVR